MSSTIQAKKRNNKNDNLHKAKSAKNDEFYTQLTDVSKELMHYKKHFKDKIVFCNCDDPTWSAFWKYFHLNFAELGLKKLISTHYDKEEATYKMEYEGGNDNDIEVGVKTPLKGNGDFRDEECLELLDECDIVVTNPMFSLFREYVSTLIEHNKKFIIWGNNNAITYKEFFPLLKNNEVWLGYTANKTLTFRIPDTYEKWDEKETTKINDGHHYAKVPAISVFTNLDIPKRHENMILWKNYTHEEYPKYDNYDAINVNKVSEIPCDYCESWGLYPEEYEALDKAQWEEVRRERKDDTELIYVIPAKDTELRQALHEHIDGYKEVIEQVLAKSIYCNGCMGVPITMLDKYNPKQLEIVNPLDVSVDKPQSEPIIANAGMQECRNAGMQECRNANSCTWSRRMACQRQTQVCSNLYPQDIVTESSECQLHSLTSIVQNSSLSSELPSPKAKDSVMDYGLKNQELHNQLLINNVDINDCLQERYCSGCVGVPITFMDKYNPKQFEIIGLGIANLGLECGVKPYKPHHKKYRKEVQHKGQVDGDLYMVDENGHPVVPYARILIRKKVGD